jgi:hypothetical protein
LAYRSTMTLRSPSPSTLLRPNLVPLALARYDRCATLPLMRCDGSRGPREDGGARRRREMEMLPPIARQEAGQGDGREEARRQTPAQVGIEGLRRNNDAVRAVSREVGFA